MTGTQVTLGQVVDTGEGCQAREDRGSLGRRSNTPWSDLEIGTALLTLITNIQLNHITLAY